MDTWFPTFYRFAASATSLTPFWPLWTTRGQQRSLLRLIAVASEESLPLVPLLEEWAGDESGFQRYRIRRFARLIAEGRPVADAAEAVPGVLADEDVLTLRFDAQSGTRTAALRARIENSTASGGNPWSSYPSTIIYFLTAVPCALLLILFVQISVLPKMQAIVSSFGMNQPLIYSWSINALYPYAIFIWIALALSIIALIWLFATQAGRRMRRASAGKLFHSVHEVRSADVLQKLNVALTAGRPVSSALSTLAHFHFDPTVRHELLVVRNNIEQGSPVWESLADVGLLTKPQANLLIVAEREGSPTWALAQLVDVKRQKVARTIERTGEFLLPAVVLIMAMLVVYQACTIFVPLIQILGGLL